MRVLLLGSTGQVGSELARALLPIAEVVAPVRPQCDAADLDSLRAAFLAARPDVVVNAAAYTAVDRAEDEPALASAVNTEAPGLLARLAREHGASLIHYSTDYVFDGRREGSYDEADATNPLSVYGKTKLDGEERVRESGCAHLILRTSWVTIRWVVPPGRARSRKRRRRSCPVPVTTAPRFAAQSRRVAECFT
jgi:dTDP-4-dehydrorhamnose reductase